MNNIVIRSVILVWGVLILTRCGLAATEDPDIISRRVKLEKAKDYFSIGQIFIKNGDYVAANAEFAKAELMLQEASITAPEEEPRDNSAEMKKAQSEKIQVEKAMSYYLDQIKKETSNPDYYFNLGIDYLNKGQFVQAEESFKLVVNLNPLDKDACYNLGILYDNYLGNKEKALKYYQQYLNIAPDSADAPQVKNWMKAIQDSIGEK
jgi:tetratricopeptide (TPR) repeat protein